MYTIKAKNNGPESLLWSIVFMIMLPLIFFLIRPSWVWSSRISRISARSRSWVASVKRCGRRWRRIIIRSWIVKKRTSKESSQQSSYKRSSKSEKERSSISCAAVASCCIVRVHAFPSSIFHLPYKGIHLKGFGVGEYLRENQFYEKAFPLCVYFGFD